MGCGETLYCLNAGVKQWGFKITGSYYKDIFNCK